MAENKNIGAIICPNCGKLISANAEQCIHCGMKNPNLWGFSGVLRKLFGGRISLVPIISAVCIGVYVLSLLLDPRAVFQGGGLLGFLAPSMPSLNALGMTGSFAMARGQWWTLITAIYLHGGLLHILFNVLWIRQLGPAVEEFYGVSRAFLIFTISGALGFLVSNYWGIPFTIGASGSIFGLLGALVYYGKKRGGTFGMAIYRQTAQWAIVVFILGFLMPGINNFAHAGGFIGGYLSAGLLGFSEVKKETHTHHLMALAAIALTVLSFLLALLT
ncbi:MAG: rhomboid family intramembrane serine protease [Calditrichaeota bacterium]|nr:MAG: rhomboid family intramembrane serine protease [Calditrichota bacterium]